MFETFKNDVLAIEAAVTSGDAIGGLHAFRKTVDDADDIFAGGKKFACSDEQKKELEEHVNRVVALCATKANEKTAGVDANGGKWLDLITKLLPIILSFFG